MTGKIEVYLRCCFNNQRRGRRHIIWVLFSAVPLLLVYFTFHKYHVGVLKSDFLIQLKENKNQVNPNVRSEENMRNRGVSSKSIKRTEDNEQDSEIHYETSTKNLISLNKLLADKIDHKTDKWQKISLNSSVKGVSNENNKAFNVTLNENRNIANKNGSEYPKSRRNNRKQPAPIKLVARMFPGNIKHVDLMKMEPFTFLEEYRNPCYAVENDRLLPLRCIPYFYLIGAPKSGTTDLFSRLIKHKEISENVIKEPKWLAKRRFSSNPNWASYEKYFIAATRDIYVKKDPDGFHPVIVGDGSPSTMWVNDYWTFLPEYKNLTEPLYTNADYIHHFNPDAKIIAIVRNPIDRLYSDYLYFTSGKDKGPDRFHEGVKFVLNTTRSCLERNTLRHCLYKPDVTVTESEVRLRIGVYHLHLKEYFRVFPKQQILVIKTEEYSKHIPEHLDKIFDFLNVARLPIEDLQEISNETKKNTRKKGDIKIGDMFPETRKLLREFHKSHNDKLGQLLGQQFNYNNDEQDLLT